jgi:hypothetical protein
MQDTVPGESSGSQDETCGQQFKRVSTNFALFGGYNQGK